MKPATLLHNLLSKTHAIKHKTRQSSLVNAVDSVLNGGKLSLTSIGRHMQRSIKTRSKIQSTNYLLGNGQLHHEIPAIYAGLARVLCAGRKELFILIDWSSIVNHEQHLLRASLVVKGRSNVVYQELHSEAKLGNHEVHKLFLKRLQSMLPAEVRVCIVVDAGFKVDFFKLVIDCGWDFVGRHLGNMLYRLEGQNNWAQCSTLYEQANDKPRYIGEADLTKTHQLKTHLYQLKKLPEQKKSKNKRKVVYGSKEKEYSNAAKKPWLIATSLKAFPANIMKIYGARMMIEHDFRDTKDPAHGLGLRVGRCRDPIRLGIMLLIGALATYILWLIGLCLEKDNLHYDFQANSYKHKRVLSLVFLALEAIRSKYLPRIKRTLYSLLEDPGNFINDRMPVQILC